MIQAKHDYYNNFAKMEIIINYLKIQKDVMFMFINNKVKVNELYNFMKLLGKSFREMLLMFIYNNTNK